MTDPEKLNTATSVNNNIEYDMALLKIKEEVLKKLVEYDRTMKYMAADIPISALCLPKATETILTSHGLLRVYDLLDCNFTEIKGLGAVRRGDLATRLDKFLSML